MGSHLFLLQMSGVPGSGKSTIAEHVVAHYGAVSLDYDVLKTAVLQAGVGAADSASPAYEAMYALARNVLAQGHHVILDSPCHWQRILDEGQSIAKEHDADYKYIECLVPDLTLIDERLQSRTTLRSQRRGVSIPPVDFGDQPMDGEALFRDWMSRVQRPERDVLRVDTHRPLTDVLPEVDSYLSASPAPLGA